MADLLKKIYAGDVFRQVHSLFIRLTYGLRRQTDGFKADAD